MNIYNLADRAKEYSKVINGSLVIAAVFAIYWIYQDVFHGIHVEQSDYLIYVSVATIYTIGMCLYIVNKAYKNNENLILYIIFSFVALWVVAVVAYALHYYFIDLYLQERIKN